MFQCVYAHSQEELRKYKAENKLDSGAAERYDDNTDDEAGDVKVCCLADSSDDEEEDEYVSVFN